MLKKFINIQRVYFHGFFRAFFHGGFLGIDN